MLRLAGFLTASVIVVTLGGCYGGVRVPHPGPPVVVHQPGPPAHAPAHGYRRKHESGADLRFDSQLGVYIVAGHTTVYFHDGWFLRLRGDAWQVSTTLGGPWKAKAVESVPPGLRAKHHAKKPKAQGRGPAKAGW